MSAKKYYAVARGRRTGVYTSWFGPQGAQVQVAGFAGARYKGFATLEEARAFVRRGGPNAGSAASARPAAALADGLPRVEVYTDGGALNNPGPGGWAAVILDRDPPTELSGGFSFTTNNRMELTAAIMALDYFEAPSAVRLHTDSRYVVDGITKGWAARWEAQGWMRTRTEPARNADLWGRLLALCRRHDVAFVWVPGHAGVVHNEHCDQLVRAMSARAGLPPDPGFS